MCRLLGVVSTTEAPITDLVPDELPPFLGLSAEHDDGWGIGWVAPDGRVDIRKEPTQASGDARFADAAESTTTGAALLHIRQASPGMPLTPVNTHPFLADGMAFAHNGYAWPTDALDAMVDATRAPAALGDTDSERYFSLVRQHLPDRSPPDALRAAAQLISDGARMTSLNCLMLGPDALYAVAWWHAPTIRSQPDGETERDYHLWYRVEAARVVVASSGIGHSDMGWQELPHGSVLEIRRDSLRALIHGAG